MRSRVIEVAEFLWTYGPYMLIASGPLAGLVLLASHAIQIRRLTRENSKLQGGKSTDDVHYNRRLITISLLLLLSGPVLYIQVRHLLPAAGSSRFHVQEAASHMEDAGRTAQRVLALADAGDYSQIYDAYSDRFRSSKTRDSFVAHFNETRKPLGKVVSRDLETVQSFDGLEDKGLKNFTVVYRYKTRFAGGKVWLETVILAFENSAWKAVGYILAPMANGPSATTDRGDLKGGPS